MEKGVASQAPPVSTPAPVPVIEENCVIAAEDGFDAVVQLHRPRVFRFILASIRDTESAENLTQECFMRAYKARDTFRGESRIGTWLMHIAANLVRGHEASSRLKFWRRSLRDTADLSDLRDSIPDRQRSPEALMLAKERLASVWTAVARLSKRQRTVFLLRFVEDMDLLEIAEITGMKESTVKTHLFRALQSMRVELEAAK
jgi:RNA polymerase sigma-70 factor (ECF subfamily)